MYSQDFATSSLKGEVAVENEQEENIKELEVYEIAQRKQWEQRYMWSHDAVVCLKDNMHVDCTVTLAAIHV